MYQFSHNYLPHSNYLLLIPNFKVLHKVAQRYIIVVMTMQINVKYRNFCMETRRVMHSDIIHLKEYLKANGTIFGIISIFCLSGTLPLGGQLGPKMASRCDNLFQPSQSPALIHLCAILCLRSYCQFFERSPRHVLLFFA